MWNLTLSHSEIESIKSLVLDLAAKYKSVEDLEFLNKACLYAHELPRRVRALLNDFRLQEPQSGVCLIAGYPVNPSKIGATPAHWKWKSDAQTLLHEQIFFVLHGALLGDLLGWTTQQDGHLVHDVFPIKGHENEQLGTGSEQSLWWHTEDAFHPYRADYIGFFCIRNPDNVATTIGTVDVNKLEASQVEALFQPRFTIRPDESHQERNESDLRKTKRQGDSHDSIDIAYQKIKTMNANPEKVSVLFGSPDAPYLRLDPYFMDPLEDDPETQLALNKLIDLIDASLTDLVLRPGDLCFIDNYRAVHGRKPFKAKYDGNDRWIKRISMTRDIRKSRQARADNAARIIL